LPATCRSSLNIVPSKSCREVITVYGVPVGLIIFIIDRIFVSIRLNIRRRVLVISVGHVRPRISVLYVRLYVISSCPIFIKCVLSFETWSSTAIVFCSGNNFREKINEKASLVSLTITYWNDRKSYLLRCTLALSR
jgi:hypothetical protein